MMSPPTPTKHYRPRMTSAGLVPTHPIKARNEHSELIELHLPNEYPLTLYLNGEEVVTLMTMGSRPEELALGYVHNQRLVRALEHIASVSVDWQRERVLIDTVAGASVSDWHARTERRIITSGCAQGSVFASTLTELESLKLQPKPVTGDEIYALVDAVSQRNETYRLSGGVHGCALCDGDEIITHIEDVGRHNAADAIAGYMWLEGIAGEGKAFYTTGRLTSEMVIKCAFMGISLLLSRSSVTYMGYQVGQQLGMTLVSRVRGKHFLLMSAGD